MRLKHVLACPLITSLFLVGCGGSVEYNAAEGGSKGADLATKPPAKTIKPGRDSRAAVKKVGAED